jgi:hypothetical protein
VCLPIRGQGYVGDVSQELRGGGGGGGGVFLTSPPSDISPSYNKAKILGEEVGQISFTGLPIDSPCPLQQRRDGFAVYLCSGGDGSSVFSTQRGEEGEGCGVALRVRRNFRVQSSFRVGRNSFECGLAL